MSDTNSGNWKKGPGGGWIPTQAPAVLPRRQAPPVPPRPAQPPMPVSPLNAAFLANPLLFIRKHSCSPPDNDESFGPEISRVMPLAGEILSGGQGSSTGGDVVRNNVKLLIRFVRLKPHPKPNFPNTVTLDLKKMREAPNDDRIPIYWLPWFSLRIMEITIPPMPSNLVDPDDDEYPRFFFTAGTKVARSLRRVNRRLQRFSMPGSLETLVAARPSSGVIKWRISVPASAHRRFERR